MSGHRTLKSSRRNRLNQSLVSPKKNSAGQKKQVVHWNQAKYWTFGKVVTTQNGHTGKVVFVGEMAIGPGLWLGLELFHPHQQNYPMVDTEAEGWSDKALIQRIIAKKQLSKRKAHNLGQLGNMTSAASALSSSSSPSSATGDGLKLSRLQRRALLKYVPCAPQHALFVLAKNVRLAVPKEEKVTASIYYRRTRQNNDVLPVKYMKLRAKQKDGDFSRSNLNDEEADDVDTSGFDFSTEEEEEVSREQIPERGRLQMNDSLPTAQLALVTADREARAHAAQDEKKIQIIQAAEAAAAERTREEDDDVSWDMTSATVRLGRQLAVFGMDGQTDLLSLLRRAKTDQKQGEALPLPKMPRELGVDSRKVILGRDTFKKSKARGLAGNKDEALSSEQSWVDKRKARFDGNVDYNERDSDSDNADEWKLQVTTLAKDLGIAGSEWAEVDAITLSSPHRNVKSLVNLSSYLTEHTTYAHVFFRPLAKLRAMYRWVAEFVTWDVTEEQPLTVERTRSDNTFSSLVATQTLADAGEFAYQQNQIRLQAEKEHKQNKQLQELRRNHTARYVVRDIKEHEFETERRREESESAQNDLMAKYASRKQHHAIDQEYTDIEKAKPNIVLLRRKGRSLGVAHLLCALCRKAGFCAVVVKGRLRLAGLTRVKSTPSSPVDYFSSPAPPEAVPTFPASGDPLEGYSKSTTVNDEHGGSISHYWVAVKLEEEEKKSRKENSDSSVSRKQPKTFDIHARADKKAAVKKRVVHTRWVQMDPFVASGFMDISQGLFCRRFVEGFFDSHERFTVSHFAHSIIPSEVTGSSWDPPDLYNAVCKSTNVERHLNFELSENDWMRQVLPTRYFSANEMRIAAANVTEHEEHLSSAGLKASPSTLHVNVLGKSEYRHVLKLLHGQNDLDFAAHVSFDPDLPDLALSRPTSKRSKKQEVRLKSAANDAHSRFQQIYERRRKQVIAANQTHHKRVNFKHTIINGATTIGDNLTSPRTRQTRHNHLLDLDMNHTEMSQLWRIVPKTQRGRRTRRKHAEAPKESTWIEFIFPHRGAYSIVVSCRDWSDVENQFLYDQVCTFTVVVKVGYFALQLKSLSQGSLINARKALERQQLGFFTPCFPKNDPELLDTLRSIVWHEPRNGVVDVSREGVSFVLSGCRDVESVVIACQGSFTVLARDVHDKQKDAKRKKYGLKSKSILLESTGGSVVLRSANVYVWVQVCGEFHLYAVFLSKSGSVSTVGADTKAAAAVEVEVEEYFKGDLGLLGRVDLKFRDQWILNRPQTISSAIFPDVYNNCFNRNIIMSPTAIHMSMTVQHADVFDSRLVFYVRTAPHIELYALLLPLWDSRHFHCEYEQAKNSKFAAGEAIQLTPVKVPIHQWKQRTFHPELTAAELRVVKARERIVQEAEEPGSAFKFSFWEVNHVFPTLLNKKRDRGKTKKSSHKGHYTLQLYASVCGKHEAKAPQFALWYNFRLDRQV